MNIDPPDIRLQGRPDPLADQLGRMDRSVMERDGSLPNDINQQRPDRIPGHYELVPIELQGDTYHIPYFVYREVTDPQLDRTTRRMKKKALLRSIKSARIKATPKGVTL